MLWTSPVGDGFCAVGDILAASGLEVALVSSGRVAILNGTTGMPLFDRALVGTADAPSGGPPALADIDGDGRMEIAVIHGTAAAVYDPECASCVMGLRWSAENESSPGMAAASFFDFNGDDVPELLYFDEYTLYVRDALTGALQEARPHASVTRTQHPVIADVDLDGDAEIVAPSSRFRGAADYVFPPEPGLHVFGDPGGRWVSALPRWTSHGFHATDVDAALRAPAAIQPIAGWRFNSTGSDPLALPNLYGTGTVSCLGGGRARLRVEVQNRGLAPAGDFQASVTRGPRGLPVEEFDVRGPIAPGESVTVERVVTWSPPMQVELDTGRAEGGHVHECREMDNLVRFAEITCP